MGSSFRGVRDIKDRDMMKHGINIELISSLEPNGGYFKDDEFFVKAGDMQVSLEVEVCVDYEEIDYYPSMPNEYNVTEELYLVKFNKAYELIGDENEIEVDKSTQRAIEEKVKNILREYFNN